jgi:hypothetical protein
MRDAGTVLTLVVTVLGKFVFVPSPEPTENRGVASFAALQYAILQLHTMESLRHWRLKFNEDAPDRRQGEFFSRLKYPVGP